jgi:hypothetical protein
VTGEVVATYSFPSGLYDFAVDAAGRMYLVCGSDSAACDLDTDFGVVEQYDRDGQRSQRRLAADANAACFSDIIVAMACATDGAIRAVEHDFGGFRCSGPGPVGASDLSSSLVQSSFSEVPAEPAYNGNLGPDVWSVAGDATRTLVVDKPVADATMSQFRLRWISATGDVLRWWGFGGNLEGPANPFVVLLTPDGAIWTVDADQGTNIGTVMFLPPGS